MEPSATASQMIIRKIHTAVWRSEARANFVPAQAVKLSVTVVSGDYSRGVKHPLVWFLCCWYIMWTHYVIKHCLIIIVSLLRYRHHRPFVLNLACATISQFSWLSSVVSRLPSFFVYFSIFWSLSLPVFLIMSMDLFYTLPTCPPLWIMTMAFRTALIKKLSTYTELPLAQNCNIS